MGIFYYIFWAVIINVVFLFFGIWGRKIEKQLEEIIEKLG